MSFIARKISTVFLSRCLLLIAISALPSLVVQLQFSPMNYWDGIQQQFSQLAKTR